jgi:hypothetical protein
LLIAIADTIFAVVAHDSGKWCSPGDVLGGGGANMVSCGGHVH